MAAKGEKVGVGRRARTEDGRRNLSDKLNTLRTKVSNLQLLIVDEISLVGSNMLL